VRRDNVQFFTKRRFYALFWLTRTSPGANFHIGGRVCVQLLTYVIMSRGRRSSLASDYSPRLIDRSRAPPLSTLGPGVGGSEFEWHGVWGEVGGA